MVAWLAFQPTICAQGGAVVVGEEEVVVRPCEDSNDFLNDFLRILKDSNDFLKVLQDSDDFLRILKDSNDFFKDSNDSLKDSKDF